MKKTKPLVLIFILSQFILAGKAQGSMDFCQIEKLASEEAVRWNYSTKGKNISINRDKNIRFLELTYRMLMKQEEIRKIALKPNVVMVVFSPVQTAELIGEDGQFFIFIDEKANEVKAVFNSRMVRLK